MEDIIDDSLEMVKKNSSSEVVEEEEGVVQLPGFRFHPTDEELVRFYLRRKVENKRMHISIQNIIKEIDIYKYDPWDLPMRCVGSGENMKECYFFCLRGRKYRNSIRPNRVTRSGFWKATGIDRLIHSSDHQPTNNSNCIGLKKSLVYYRGSAGKGTKTDWMMHEFRLPPPIKGQEAEVWTITRIFQRNITSKKFTIQNWMQQSTLSASTTIQQTTTTMRTTSEYPADSSSKTSSFDSDTGDEWYRYSMGCASSVLQQGEISFTNQNYIQEQSQVYGGQWVNIPTIIQSPVQFPTTLHHRYHHPIIPSPNNVMNHELFKDGNWGEFGRMMDEYIMDPIKDCGYLY